MKILINPKSLSFSFEIPAMEKSEGVQKILGFSRGWHHWNSVRLGIRKENDYCVLYLYAYVNGKFIEPTDELRLNGKYKQGDNVYCMIRYEKTLIRLTILQDSVYYSLPYGFKPCKIGYLLRPYREQDGKDNKRKPFDVRVWDIKCNEKEIKL